MNKLSNFMFLFCITTIIIGSDYQPSRTPPEPIKVNDTKKDHSFITVNTGKKRGKSAEEDNNSNDVNRPDIDNLRDIFARQNN